MNKKIICLYSFLILFSNILSAQGIINNYPFGYSALPKARLSFPGNSPSVNLDSGIALSLRYTHANISDTAGNMLFYTNGITVIGRNNDSMPNGDWLNPCQYTTQVYGLGLSLPQADLILPDPGNSSRYYLIHQSTDNQSTYTNSVLYYSIIDMNLNNGHGDITQKNVVLYNGLFWGAGTTACKHANGRDWWIVVLKAHFPVYFIFLLTPSGISYSSSQTIGSRWEWGQTAFSRDGMHYAINVYQTNFQVFDFDRCTGIFSNPRIVPISDSLYGASCCFSPDSKILYASNAFNLYQANLDSFDLAAGTQVVARWDTTYDPIFGPPFQTGFEYMQIGPDDKIYMTTTWATHNMQYINYPDSIGIACDMKQHSILLPTPNGNTIPNFPNYFLGPVIGSICDSLGLGITETIYDKNLNLRINPNPAQGSFYVNYELPTGKDAVLYVYNSMGQKIHTQRIYSVNKYLQVHCDTWKPGVYFVKVVMDRDRFAANARVVVY